MIPYNTKGMAGKTQHYIYSIIYLLLFTSSLLYGKTNSRAFLTASRKEGLMLKQRLACLDSAMNVCKDTTGLLYYEIVAERSQLLFKDAQYYKVAQLTSKYLRRLDVLKHKTSSDYFKRIHSDLLFWYGYSLAHMSRYNEAIKQFYEIAKRYGLNEESVYAAKAYRGLGLVYGMCSKQNKAEEYFRKHLDISKKLNDYESISGSLTNLGILRLQRQQPDSALVFFLEANKVAVQHRHQCDEARILYLIGAAYCYLGQDEFGNKYLQEAIPAAEKQGDYRLVSFIYDFTIQNLVKTGNDSQAKKECLKHYEVVKKYQAKSLEASALLILSGISEREGNYKQAYHYLKLHQEINKYILNEESEERLEAQSVDFDNYKTEQAKEIMRKDMQLSKITLEKRNLWIAILLVIIILIAGILAWFTNRFITQRKLNKILHNRISHLHDRESLRMDSIQNRLKEELNQKDKELMSNLLTQVNVKDTIAAVLHKLLIIKRNFSSVGKESVVIGEMETLLNSLNNSKDWEAFQLYFEQVNDSFLESLTSIYPSLTPGEKRLCALISLNLTTKEIASLINRTVRGIETAKFRLRKKMQLTPDDNLHEIIAQLKNGSQANIPVRPTSV